MKSSYKSIFNAEYQYNYHKQFCVENYISDRNLDRLDLEKTLKGHTGCVNCLEWSENGEILGSGSDDCKVFLWNYFTNTHTSFSTGHTANIFSLKFLPQYNSNLIVTGSADTKVIVNDSSVEKIHTVFNCNLGRVKRLATCPRNPYLFWSAAEDGTIRQYDIREPFASTEKTAKNVLIDLCQDLLSLTEARCLAVNPSESQYIAVGSNDHVIRVYDRRNLRLQEKAPKSKPTSPNIHTNSNLNSFRYCLAPRNLTSSTFRHIIKRKFNLQTSCFYSATYVTYSADGREILANIGNNAIYLYDTNSSFSWNSGYQPDHDPLNRFFIHDLKQASSVNKDVCKSFEYVPKEKLFPKEEFKATQASIRNKNYQIAIDRIGQLKIKYPDNPTLLILHSIGLILRYWQGDTYEALKNSERALEILKTSTRNHDIDREKLDEARITAELISCRCLIDLYWFDEAKARLTILSEQPNSGPFMEYFKKISDALESYNLYCDHKTESRHSIYQQEFMDNLQNNFSESGKNGVYWNHWEGNPDEEKKSFDKDCVLCDTLKNILNKFQNIFDANSSNWFNLEMKYILKNLTKPDSLVVGANFQSYIPKDYGYRILDYKYRYVGHSNVTTEIKEAVFLGLDESYIAAGSDCGTFVIWSKKSGNIIRMMNADELTVNCIAPHPQAFLMATSGIDNSIKMWSPRPYFFESSSKAHSGYNHSLPKYSSRVVRNVSNAARINQGRSDLNPIHLFISSIGNGTGIGSGIEDNDSDNEDDDTEDMYDHNDSDDGNSILDQNNTLPNSSFKTENQSQESPDFMESHLYPKIAKMIFDVPLVSDESNESFFSQSGDDRTRVVDMDDSTNEEGIEMNRNLRTRILRAVHRAYGQDDNEDNSSNEDQDGDVVQCLTQ